MFKGCLTTILIGVLMFIFIIGIILLIAWGLGYVLDYIPCEILVYVETGVLLGIFMLMAGLLVNTKRFKEFYKGITLGNKTEIN